MYKIYKYISIFNNNILIWFVGDWSDKELLIFWENYKSKKI